jgi:hypothetical protein
MCELMADAARKPGSKKVQSARFATFYWTNASDPSVSLSFRGAR